MSKVFLQLFKLKYNDTVLQTGIHHYEQAIALRKLYAQRFKVDETLFTIIPHKTPVKASDELAQKILRANESESKRLKALKVISGKGLKYKTAVDRETPKYDPTKYLPKEVWFAQSAERNKGISTIAHLKDKKPKTHVIDIETAKFISEYERNNQSLSSQTRTEYAKKIKPKFKRFNDLFKHIQSTFSLTRRETKLILNNV